MKLFKHLTLALTLALLSSELLLAHGGRRLDVVVIDGKLHAQGYNSGSFDRADYLRPYTNAIHNHWAPGSDVTSLPGFDVTFANSFVDETGTTQAYGYQNDARELEGFDLSIELTLGFDLVTDWSNPRNRLDLDPSYLLDLEPEPTGSIYFLQWQLSSDNPEIESSDAVYTIFSPPGQVHPQSLALEQTLGTSLSAVPEPSAVALIGLGLSILAVRRRRS